MKTSSTPSESKQQRERNKQLRDKQIEKLCSKVRDAARKAPLTVDQFQRALGYPGRGLTDAILKDIVDFAKLAQGIVFPKPAIETGLIPEGYRLVSDNPETEFDPTKLRFYKAIRPEDPEQNYIYGRNVIQRGQLWGCIGSLGLAEYVLSEQEAGRIPLPPWRGVRIVLYRTILLNEKGIKVFPTMVCKDDANRWELEFKHGVDGNIAVLQDNSVLIYQKEDNK